MKNENAIHFYTAKQVFIILLHCLVKHHVLMSKSEIVCLVYELEKDRDSSEEELQEVLLRAIKIAKYLNNESTKIDRVVTKIKRLYEINFN